MARRYDSFGVGFYHDEFKELTAGTAKLSDGAAWRPSMTSP
jgi:hypothetical protein